jgi:hypothetical protein
MACHRAGCTGDAQLDLASTGTGAVGYTWSGVGEKHASLPHDSQSGQHVRFPQQREPLGQQPVKQHALPGPQQ